MSTAKHAPIRKRQSDVAILDAAEILFGRHGVDGVSFRQIATVAGCSNHHAVQYHFTDKPTLIRAIYERRLRSLEVKRGTLLEVARKAGKDADPRALLEIVLRPIADEIDVEGRRSYAAFLLGLRVNGELDAYFGKSIELAPLSLHVSNLLRESLKYIPPEIFSERLRAAVTVFLGTAVDCTYEPSASISKEEKRLQAAIDFGAAGLTSASADWQSGSLECHGKTESACDISPEGNS
jgi:AcrR family transcriptional regulator